LDEVTYELEKNMTDEEIEIQDYKLSQTTSKTGRPRSHLELNEDEKDYCYKNQCLLEIPDLVKKGIIRS